MRKIWWHWLVFFGLLIVIVGFGAWTLRQPAPPTFDSHNGKLKVVATLFPLYDFIRAIGQDKVDVLLLLPPGTEAHSFEPRAQDVVQIANAAVFVYTGPLMEPWVATLLAGLHTPQQSVVNASQHLTILAADPHVWLDMDNAKIIVQDIAQALAQQDPAQADFYRHNAEAYQQQLDLIDQAYRSGLANCQQKNIVFGGHYALGYLAHRYGLQYEAAQGVAPDAEPTVNDLASLIAQVKEKKLTTIFYEELSSPKIAQTLAQETSAQLLQLSSAHNISRDELNHHLSFIDIMQKNLATLRRGLQCE